MVILLSRNFREVIKVNQDPLGIQGLRIKYENGIEVSCL